MATINGNSENNNLIGTSARDILNGGAGIDTLVGGTGNDIYIVDSTTDIIRENSGGGVHDTVRASMSYILGNYLNDLTLTETRALNGTGNSYDNIITGNNGDNQLVGDDGDDKFYGEDGKDDLNGGDGNDTLYSGAGDDFIIGLTGSDIAYGGDGNDTIVDNSGGFPNNNNVFYGGKGNDFLDSSDGNDKLYGESGNDTLSGREGDDILDGRPGSDLADYSGFGSSAGEINVNLTTGKASGIAGNDTLISIGNVLGSVGNDTLIGNANDNTLYGDPEPFIEDYPPSGSNDDLDGRDGNDTLVGGFGRDTLTSGAGSDTFIFTYPEEGVDRITDFSSSTDRIQVVHADGSFALRFGGGLQEGAITAAQFYLGSAAHDSSDRFIYNRSTGALYFDSDGIGSAAQIQFVILSNNASINANDIFVV